MNNNYNEARRLIFDATEYLLFIEKHMSSSAIIDGNLIDIDKAITLLIQARCELALAKQNSPTLFK